MPGPGFKPVELGEEMESLVTNALIPSPQDEVLSSGFRLHIKRKDMSTLRPEQWLNDEIINFYCSLLAERSTQGAGSRLFIRACWYLHLGTRTTTKMKCTISIAF